MYYFHIEYLKKGKVKRFIVKAKEKTTALKIFKKELLTKDRDKTKLLKCNRSNKINNTYYLKDAKWIVYQNLKKRTKKELSIKKVKLILNLFYDYLNENSFHYKMKNSEEIRTKAHFRDENIPPKYCGNDLLLSALDVCSYVQITALIKFGNLFYFNDIYKVFVAETKYLEEIDISQKAT